MLIDHGRLEIDGGDLLLLDGGDHLLLNVGYSTPVFATGRAPSTGPGDRYPEPPYDSARVAAPVQYRDGAVPYDPSP